MKDIGKPLLIKLQIIKAVAKELQITKFYAMFLVLVMLVGALSLSLTFSLLTNNVIIRSSGKIATAPITYKSEIRGVFVHCASFNNPDWDLIAQTCKDYGINVIVGEFLGFGGGYYGDSPYGDQLGMAINACHSLGIKVYVSHTLFYVTPEHHPELHAERHNGTVWSHWICPTKQGTRNIIKRQLEEVVTNYDIDGYMFDYIRYDTLDMCYCDECRSAFEEWLGEEIGNWTDFYPGGSRHEEFVEWRIVSITNIVKDVREWMLAINPDLEFSVAAFTLFQNAGQYWRYWIGQDTADWVRNNYLGSVAPMIYTTNLTNIQDYLENDFNFIVGGPEGKIPLVCLLTNCYPSIVDPWDFKAEIDLVRSMGADGWIIFRYDGPGDGEGSNSPDIRDYLSIIDMPDVFSLENIQVSTGENHATISWTTVLPATSRVEYSTSPLFNASWEYNPTVGFHYWDIDHVLGTNIEDNSNVTTHSITLTNLTPETKYYFRVQSEGSGGIATSKVLTFNTLKQT